MAAVPGFIHEETGPGDYLIAPGAANETRRPGHRSNMIL